MGQAEGQPEGWKKAYGAQEVRFSKCFWPRGAPRVLALNLKSSPLPYLEGHGDLVTGLIMGITGVIIWLMGVISILTKSP